MTSRRSLKCTALHYLHAAFGMCAYAIVPVSNLHQSGPNVQHLPGLAYRLSSR